MGFPTSDHFGYEDGLRLLRKKLYGLVVARAGVSSRQRFDKSVLHIFCQSWAIAIIMREAFMEVSEQDDTIRETVVVLLTVADGAPEIFFDDVTLLALVRD